MKMITYTLNAIRRLKAFFFPPQPVVEERFFDIGFFSDIYSSDKSHLRMVTMFEDIFTYIDVLRQKNELMAQGVRVPEQEMKYALIFITDFFRIKGLYLKYPVEAAEAFLAEAENFIRAYDDLDERDPVQSFNRRSLANLKANLEAIGVIFNGSIEI